MRVKDLRVRNGPPAPIGSEQAVPALPSGQPEVIPPVMLFAFGTLKRGFPLYDRGLAGTRFLGRGTTVERFPMVIAGPWYAPMMLNEPGLGLRIEGELFEVDEERLRRLDGLESIGRPGNLRIRIDVEPEGSGVICSAFAYCKARALATPLHSGWLARYADRRFVAPEDRPAGAS